MSDKIPNGWDIVQLSDVVPKPRPKVSPKDYPELPFIGMDHIKPGGMELLGEASFGDMKSNGCSFQVGDVLYGRMRPYLNKVHHAKKSGACSAEFIVFPRGDAIESQFLAYLLHHRKFVNFSSSKSSGDRPRVDFGSLADYEFALPPYKEQERIASKIDELFSRIEEGERALDRVSKLVERYRQSVLKAAVTGELTREWREENKGNVESREALLERILKARREAWEQTELEKMIVKGKPPTNDKWKQKYKEPMSPDTTGLPGLPDGWVWTSIESLCLASKHALKAGPFGSSLKKSDYSERGYKVYGQEQVIAGDWSIGDYYIGEEKYMELESCQVQPMDVLISLVGTIGKVLVLPDECESGIINPRLIKVSLNKNAYLPAFFKVYFESEFLKSLYKLVAHGATMDVLNMSIIKGLPFPLCSVEEQYEIVDRSMYEFDRIIRADEWCGAERARSLALRQSVLKSAFTGSLISQDPADEPASVLLERITSEREAMPPVTRCVRKKKFARKNKKST